MTVSTVPWQTEEEWSQVEVFFRGSMRAVVDSRGLTTAAQIIASRIADVDAELDRLCRLHCPSCDDICCVRATVWYDFRDLLFLYCLQEKLPSAQILSKTGKGCNHLGAQGCALPRVERPFVCTWYLCPAQRATIRWNGGERVSVDLISLLKKIQRQRRDLENRFFERVV